MNSDPTFTKLAERALDFGRTYAGGADDVDRPGVEEHKFTGLLRLPASLLGRVGGGDEEVSVRTCAMVVRTDQPSESWIPRTIHTGAWYRAMHVASGSAPVQAIIRVGTCFTLNTLEPQSEPWILYEPFEETEEVHAVTGYRMLGRLRRQENEKFAMPAFNASCCVHAVPALQGSGNGQLPVIPSAENTSLAYALNPCFFSS